jgi:DNA helicase-2/ATP-dependent DNA helicase PcrA
MAASSDSPVAQLLGLISYLVDPVSYKVGATGRRIMVAASMGDAAKSSRARSVPPPFPLNQAHLNFQKRFFKSDGGDIGRPTKARAPVIELVDVIRQNLIGTKKPRLTLAGFISRLLALPFFRNSGFTTALFRQALFTQLLEANVAPTRLTMQSLDRPLELKMTKGRYEWPPQYWTLLSVFGSYLDNAPLDDPEIESFEENSVLLLTFHQGKGLEFDHVYIAGTGRPPDLGPALRTKLFSGDQPKYGVAPRLASRNPTVIKLAAADRDREVYVAMTRAKQRLTILYDPKSGSPFMALNPAVEALFKSASSKSHKACDNLAVKDYRDG